MVKKKAKPELEESDMSAPKLNKKEIKKNTKVQKKFTKKPK